MPVGDDPTTPTSTTDLHPAEPVAFTRVKPDRRNLSSREVLVGRVRSYFEEHPRPGLSVAEAARVFDLAPEVCARIFTQFLEEDCVRLTPGGRFVCPGASGRRGGGDARSGCPDTI